ncbi:UNVERIFIED_CONTAM: hypothetical protein RMT77_009129 [Armadillidium vulgare]
MRKTLFISILIIFMIQASSGKKKVNKERGTDPNTCDKGYFSCGDSSSVCIPQLLVCDGTFDCRSGNDEMNCAQLRTHNLDDEESLNRDIPTFNLEIGEKKPI